jgi:hypothetical protein
VGIEALKDAIYDGVCVEGGVQYSESEKGTLEIILDCLIEVDGSQIPAQTFLYFNEKTYPFSVERLRAAGWEGDDLSNLAGIGKNKIKFQKSSETFEGKLKHKIQIASGGGRFETKKPVDPKQFAARVAAIMGGNKSGPAPVVKPPF